MVRTYSLLVILAMYLSTCNWIHFMSTFFLTGTSLVPTESHSRTRLEVEQFLIKTGWQDASFGFCNLAKVFKHNTIYLAIKTVTTMIHYCYC